MSRARSILLAGVLAAVVATLAAVPAGAATVAIDQGVLKYTGAPSEANRVRIYYDAQNWVYVVEDTGVTSTAVTGPWCTASTPQVTRCNFGKVASADIQLGGGGGSSAQNQTSLLPVTLRAGSGHDSLIGGSGPTTTKLIGGSGGTTMTGGKGPSAYTGGPAGDVVQARNGVNESVACGGGADTVEADAGDTVAADCETVSRGTAGDASTPSAPDPVVGTALPDDVPVGDPEPAPAPITISHAPVTLDAQNRVPVEVTCPQTSAGGCEGQITLSLPAGNDKVVAARRQRRIVGRSRKFRLAAGEKAVVPVALSRRGARAFRRRAPKKTRRARKLVVTVAVRTAAGVKTVTSTITVKERRRTVPRRSRR